MVGKEESSANALPLLSARKTYWRSASWSSSRTDAATLGSIGELGSGNQCCDVGGECGNSCLGLNGGHSESNRRCPAPVPAPLTPRSQQNLKARSCLPPLQPLSISRRSLDDWPKAGSDDVGEWPHHPQPSTPSGNRVGCGGERLKLDMTAIQRSECRNSVTGLVKREKIAFFDKECSKVAEHIYLGGDMVARDREILRQNGITHVLNCVGFACPEYFKGDFVYQTLWLQDTPSEDITSILYDVFDYFEDVREQRGRVFVHCCQGVSRSTSLVIAYRMWREGQSFDDAFQFVKAARGIADPNMGFACQLLQCQKRVHAFPLSPSSLLRMYRIAPHSPYDPLHLVPKMLSDPSLAALDSRGAFIVQVPSCLYVWVGMDCDPVMERDARGAVCQIGRYERVQGPVVMIKEGSEASYFWDAFENYLPLMMDNKTGGEMELGSVRDWKTCSGQRKLDSYDVDFEIFKRAVKGGVLPPFSVSENENEMCLPAKESSWSLLRRKFAPSNLKDFVSAPKLIFSRVYSESMMVVHSPANPSPVSATASTSSSCSPSYLSPDSIFSDSSTSSKSFSESSQDSPSTTSSSSPISSNSTGFSKFSNLSLQQSKPRPQHFSKCKNYIDINFPSRQHPQSITSPNNKLSPSLAERRGGSSRTLKLQVMNNSRMTSGSGTEEDGFLRNCMDSSAREPVVEAFCVVDPNLSARFATCLELRRGLADPVDCVAPAVSSQLGEFGSEYTDQVGYVVRRWPSLEEVIEFRKTDFHSDTTLIFTPTGAPEKLRFLYLWLGKLVGCQGDESAGGDSPGVDVLEKKWNEDSRQLPRLLGLPKDTSIKIVKEGEEPEEFLAILRSISSSGRRTDIR